MPPFLGKLYVVATPIGNLSDISERAYHTLSKVSWVAAEDTRHSKTLLQHLGLSTPLISYHDYNEQDRALELIERLRQGENGALISDAGTPLISDPGYSLVFAAHQAGIEVIAIPGPCAPIAALSISGLPTDKFLFEGFLSSKKSARCRRLEELSKFPNTMVFLEAPHRILNLVEDCTRYFSEVRQSALARELTKKFESIYVKPLGELLEDLRQEKIPNRGEFVLVVSGSASIQKPHSQEEQEMYHILNTLLSEVSLKQAVQIASKLTGYPKNALYDCAMKIQKENPKEYPKE